MTSLPEWAWALKAAQCLSESRTHYERTPAGLESVVVPI